MEKRIIYFNKFYKKFNILSLFLILISLILLTFKGLNYVDVERDKEIHSKILIS